MRQTQHKSTDTGAQLQTALCSINCKKKKKKEKKEKRKKEKGKKYFFTARKSFPYEMT